MRWFLSVLALAALQGCQCKSREASMPTPTTPSAPALRTPDTLETVIDRLQPLHDALPKPRPGDWLSEHDEPGQTFHEYCDAAPNKPEPGGRDKLYIQPLGHLTSTQRQIVAHAASYMEQFFGLAVATKSALSLDVIPAKARRGDQILSTFVLDQVLKPRLPEDAAASISLTASDLWPGKGWNFVFGQASLRDRVGVWSMHRYGDPDQDKSAYKRALLRTLKVAVHETGHLFSIEHCTAYACVMNGSNSLDETDRHPLWMCPQCMAKIAWATQLSPVLRYQRLAELAQGHGLTREVAFFQRSIEVLR